MADPPNSSEFPTTDMEEDEDSDLEEGLQELPLRRRESARSYNNSSGSDWSLSTVRSNFGEWLLREESDDRGGGLGLLDQDRPSLIDGLLCELYDRIPYGLGRDSLDSDTYTEYSSTSEVHCAGTRSEQELEPSHLTYTSRVQSACLREKEVKELRQMVEEQRRRTNVISQKLVRQLKRRDRRKSKLQKNCDILTAILQAVSEKRRIDTRMKFSIEPMPGKKGFRQWFDAMKAVVRLPHGLPSEWRKRVWLCLADKHIQNLQLDWEKMCRLAFNERSNPDDDKLGVQIVKDLHRTGCSGFCAEQDRVVLKRVLLAYARWNKSVGYCQGFNVLAALVLEVVERVEEDALKVMIYLIDYVLPDSFFANNLRALSVDMAVFRELLRIRLPDLSKHLDDLQKRANSNPQGNYEPPLTNVFVMQWFLTLFATCLPKSTVLRVWDSVFFEGSEILLRTALAIWAKLGDRLRDLDSADQFYGTMAMLCQEMLMMNLIDPNELVQTVYSLAPFPFPGLDELREKYTYNITPFSPLGTDKAKKAMKMATNSDEEVELDEDDLAMAIGCFGGIFPPETSPKKRGEKEGEQKPVSDMREVSPGAYSSRTEHIEMTRTALMERMSTDITALKKQYMRIRQKQQRTHLIYPKQGNENKSKSTHKFSATARDTPIAMNHLYVARKIASIQGKTKRIKGPEIRPTPQRGRHPSDGRREGARRESGNEDSDGGVEIQIQWTASAGISPETAERRSSEHSVESSVGSEGSGNTGSKERESVDSREGSVVSDRTGMEEIREEGKESEVCDTSDSEPELKTASDREVERNNTVLSPIQPSSEDETHDFMARGVGSTCDSSSENDSTVPTETWKPLNTGEPDVSSADNSKKKQRPTDLDLQTISNFSSKDPSPSSTSSNENQRPSSPTIPGIKSTKAHLDSAGMNAGKFNPFPRPKQFKTAKTKNGVQLSLYKQTEENQTVTSPTKGPFPVIKRSHINQCLQRQYMASASKSTTYR
ncbi:TBC1 domain family member 30-like isoform X1 [Branchiostoma lanceolatum]|uniref:TBC1 domain family member 30-like isoform X1 n=1 Tax=Branchiostoma lanceolatum TaxID=7740 RepID=UPI0034519130